MIRARGIAEYIAKEVRGEKDLNTLLAFVKDRHLDHLLPQVYEQLLRFQSREQNAEELELITAHPISPDTKKAILAFVHADEEVVRERIDEEYIGGFKVSYKNKLYDATLQTQLEKLERALTK